MTKNVFVPALTVLQRRELATLRNADQCAVHSLLDTERLVEPDHYEFGNLLAQAREQLDSFQGSIDAIVPHWDFPTSVLAPILAQEYDLPSPSLESVLKCEHKYWSRLEQAEAVPECVPGFRAFDPFDDNALDTIDLPFPFWVKPVKSFASQLGFQIENEQEFQEALKEIREHIGRIGDAFDEALQMVELPDAVRESTGTTCLAEQIITGTQSAPEGSIYRGEFDVHGIFDMLKGADGHSFDRLEYPSAFPEEAQERMIDICERYLRHIGYDNGCFNAEFMWDRTDEKLWLIEVNTRISQSHSDMFVKVDGISNHEVAVDIALGQRPVMPKGKGPYEVAAQCHITHDEDGIVTRIPSEEEIAQIGERYPETVVELVVSPGDRLSELHNQGTYTFELGVMYVGADSREHLVDRYHHILDELHFEFDPVDEG